MLQLRWVVPRAPRALIILCAVVLFLVVFVFAVALSSVLSEAVPALKDVWPFLSLLLPFATLFTIDPIERLFTAWDDPDEELSIAPHVVVWRRTGVAARTWEPREIESIMCDDEQACITIHLRDGSRHEVGSTGQSVTALSELDRTWALPQLTAALREAQGEA